MRTIEKKHQRVLAAILIGLLAMPCGLQAQNANKQVWWLKTDKGQYIEMSRVKKLANVNEKEAFEVIAHQGQGASGVLNVTFEKNSLVVVNGDASGNGIVDGDDVKEIAAYILGSKSDNFDLVRADINGDGKVDVVDLVAAVNIAKAPKVGVRGLSLTGLQKSVSDDVPGTTVPDDVPGTIKQDDDQGTVGQDEPVPGTIIPEEPETPRDPAPDDRQVEIWPIEPLPGTINPPVRPVPNNNPQTVIQEPITIEPEPLPIIPQPEPVADLGSVPYFRVQFTENLLEVAKWAKEGPAYTFFNPAYDYLDFKYSLPLTDDNLSGSKPDYECFYYIGYSPKDHTRLSLTKTDGSLAIKKIWAYNLPIKFITVSTEGFSRELNGKRYITYSFNALPRNIEELKTLEVNNREYFNSPHFVTALFICCLNRMTDNSSDAWNMINYLRTHTATVGENNILKVSNVVMQDVVQNLLEKDTNGYPVSNGLRSYFEGSSPDNKYTPTAPPYKVTIVEQSDIYTTEDGVLCAKLYAVSSGDDNLVGPLKLREIEDHGWLVYSGEQVFTKKMKPQN